MKYGVLTTNITTASRSGRARASDFNVGHIPWRNGKGDVVREFVDAFRSRGLLPGLYYSIWDTTEDVGAGHLTPAKLAYVKTQLTELLTNYGPIAILIIDGWSWQMGHNAVAYQEIRGLVKSLQPNCLLTDHAHLADPWDMDVVNFEEPRGGWAPAGNTYPAPARTEGECHRRQRLVLGTRRRRPDDGRGRGHEAPRGSWSQVDQFPAQLPPQPRRQAGPAIVKLLHDVGAAWTPNLARPPLPAQPPQNEHPYTPVSATATSGDASAAIDGKNDTDFISMWQPTGALPQSITLDLGRVQPDVGWLGCVPRYHHEKSSKDGNVTDYRILTSTDGPDFSEATAGTWPADGRMKVATFGPAPARYVRFEIRAANGKPAVTEITVGGRRKETSSMRKSPDTRSLSRLRSALLALACLRRSARGPLITRYPSWCRRTADTPCSSTARRF